MVSLNSTYELVSKSFSFWLLLFLLYLKVITFNQTTFKIFHSVVLNNNCNWNMYCWIILNIVCVCLIFLLLTNISCIQYLQHYRYTKERSCKIGNFSFLLFFLFLFVHLRQPLLFAYVYGIFSKVFTLKHFNHTISFMFYVVFFFFFFYFLFFSFLHLQDKF